MSSCTCRSEIEAKLLSRFVESATEATKHEVKLAGYAFVLTGNSLEMKGFMPVELTAEYPLKKGGHKAKTVKQNMVFRFCPFCGEKYSKPKSEVTA